VVEAQLATIAECRSPETGPKGNHGTERGPPGCSGSVQAQGCTPQLRVKQRLPRMAAVTRTGKKKILCPTTGPSQLGTFGKTKENMPDLIL